MIKLLFIMLVTAFLLFDAPASYAGRIKVIASINPAGDFARQVGGDKVEVKVLLPAGASPHTFEPTPGTIKNVSVARVFIKIGAGLELWAEKILKSSVSKNRTVIELSEGIPLISMNDGGHGQRHAHEKSEYDPHLWLDPVNVVLIVDKIQKALSAADPQNAEYYKKNAASYKDALLRLDRELEGRVKKLRIKEYVTFHPAWNYFSRRYGLKVAGVIEESPGKEPGPKHISGIIKEVRRLGSRVIFVEPQFNPKIADVIAREAGARVVYLDPIGGQKGRETYIDMMRYNIASIESAMK